MTWNRCERLVDGKPIRVEHMKLDFHYACTTMDLDIESCQRKPGETPFKLTITASWREMEPILL